MPGLAMSAVNAHGISLLITNPCLLAAFLKNAKFLLLIKNSLSESSDASRSAIKIVSPEISELQYLLVTKEVNVTGFAWDISIRYSSNMGKKVSKLIIFEDLSLFKYEFANTSVRLLMYS